MGMGEEAGLAGEDTAVHTEAGGGATHGPLVKGENRLQKVQGLPQGWVVSKWQGEQSRPSFLPPTLQSSKCCYHKNHMRASERMHFQSAH